MRPRGVTAFTLLFAAGFLALIALYHSRPRKSVKANKNGMFIENHTV